MSGDEGWINLLERWTGLAFVNMGVPGYSSIQATRMLERYGMLLGPKMVLWGFTPNDIDDNLIFNDWEGLGAGTDFISYGARRRKQELDRMDPMLGRVREWLREHSLVYELLRLAVRGIDRVVYRNGELELVFDPSEWEETLASQLYERGARLTMEAIKGAQRLSERGGARLVVVVFPSRAQAHWPLLRQRVQDADSLDIDRRTRLVADFCRQQGVQVLDLSGPIRERANRGEQLFFRFDGHFNRLGNIAVADAVFDFLTIEGLARRPLKRHGES